MNFNSENKVEAVKMMKRYCSKCEEVEPNSDKLDSRAKCTKCAALLHYQCVRCYSVLAKFRCSFNHLRTKSCRIAKVDPDTENQPETVKMNITSEIVDLLRPSTMITRYCSKCEEVAANARKVKPNASCPKCGTYLHYQCLNCNIVFTLYSSIIKHLKDRCKFLKKYFKTNNKRHKCNECTFKTSYKYNLKSHVNTYHSSDKDKNNDNIPTNAEVVDQLPKFNTMMTRYCTNCEAIEPNVKHSTKKPCMKCGKQLDYRCLKCSKLYTEYKSLHIHIKNTCNPREGSIKIRHKCNECIYETSYICNLKRHLTQYHSLGKDGNEVNITTDTEWLIYPYLKR